MKIKIIKRSHFSNNKIIRQIILLHFINCLQRIVVFTLLIKLYFKKDTMTHDVYILLFTTEKSQLLYILYMYELG